MNIVEMDHAVRFFGATPAVTDMCLAVPKGSVFGLLGENGSGKTTSIKMMMGALIPQEGTVRVFGVDPLTLKPEQRARIAYIADDMGLPNWMKLSEGMALHRSYFQQWDQGVADERLERYGLRLNQSFGTLSKGQKRQFLLTLALAQQPDLLILDEPASGLDVSVRRDFLDSLMELANTREVSVLLSSHILTDVERVVDHVSFMKKGACVRQANLEDMKEGIKRLCFSENQDRDVLLQSFSILQEKQVQGGYQVVVEDFAAERMDGLDCHVEHLNLEELFLVFNALSDVGAVR